MKKYAYGFILILFVSSVLFAGCASTDSRDKDVSAANPEQGVNKTDTGKLKDIPLSEFMLGVGDSIEVAVYRHDELKRTAKIDISGKIMFPLIGDVVVAGKGVYELRSALQARFSKYIIDPQVFVTVTGVQSQKVIVTGEVTSPGMFTFDTPLSATEAIFKAGGITKNAKSDKVLLIRKGGRGSVSISSFNLDRILKKGDNSQERILENGDIIYVPATTIADLNTFLSQFSQILGTIVNVESGIVLWPQVKDAIKGTSTTTISISPSSK